MKMILEVVYGYESQFKVEPKLYFKTATPPAEDVINHCIFINRCL